MFRIKNLFFLLVIMLFTSGNMIAANYYFSTSSGDDTRSNVVAQHALTPWKTIGKLNSISLLLKPGDSIFFRRGEIFYGSVELNSSGSNAAPIVVTAYGKGSNPIISGLSSLTSWQLSSQGIYSSNCSACKTVVARMLLINGVQQAMGRYPNSGYLTYLSHQHNKSIGSTETKNSTEWRGAELVIRKNHWLIDRCVVTEQSGGTLSYNGGSATEPTDGFGYFIQNDRKTLDRFGEWYYDPSSEAMVVYFGDKAPSSYRVEVTTTNNLITIEGRHSISIENLSLTGAASSAFYLKNARDIRIRNCVADLSATDGIDGSGITNLLVEHSTISHSLNTAIKLDSSCRSAIVRYNKIKNTGVISGMGKSGSGTYQAVSVFGGGSIVEGNEIDSTGYNAIYFGGNATIISNNLITHFCTVKDDGAGIYMGDWFPSSGKKITQNIILNGIGAREGSNEKGLIPVEGIYIDDNSADVEILSNSIAACPDAGIKIHNAKNIRLEGNTVFNNGIQLLVAHDNLQPQSPVRNVQGGSNILFSLKPEQLCLYIYSVNDDLRSMVLMDNNCYYRPAADQSVIKAVANIWSAKSVTSDLSLVQWKNAYNQDQHSKTIVSAVDQRNVAFEYNFSPKIREISQRGTYVTQRGLESTSKILIQSYQSAIIFNSVTSKH